VAVLPAIVDPVDVKVPAFHTPVPVEVPPARKDVVLSSTLVWSNVSVPVFPTPDPAALPASLVPVFTEFTLMRVLLTVSWPLLKMPAPYECPQYANTATRVLPLRRGKCPTIGCNNRLGSVATYRRCERRLYSWVGLGAEAGGD